jgi:tRNA nucleotidyltransferase/poly(A) polymerase
MHSAPLSCPREQPPWREALAVHAALVAAGHQAYAVGGGVRDLLLGRPVHDVDLATAARPEQIEALFKRTVAVGKSFGVVIVVTEDGAHVEVATFRHDGAYHDGRRPETVAFCTAEDDVKRRDFTVNALLYDPAAGRVLDHVGGLADLAGRTLRAVGDARARMEEDRLRILRGLRFAAQLDLRIEDATWAAIRATPATGLSAERVVQEWFKGLAGGNRARWLNLLHESGHLITLCPPLSGLAEMDRQRLAECLDRLVGDDDPAVAAAVWLAPLGEAARDWLGRQPLSSDLNGRIRWLLDQGREPGRLAAQPRAERRRLAQSPHARQLVRFLGVRFPANSAAGVLAADLAAENAAGPWRPLVGARDLIAMGCRPGPELGRLLRRLEDAQLEGAFATREAGIDLARRWISQPDA